MKNIFIRQIRRQSILVEILEKKDVECLGKYTRGHCDDKD